MDTADEHPTSSAAGTAHGGTFEQVYACHQPSLTRLARRLCRDPELAEDVVQEVFVRLWRRPERFDPRRGSLRTFLLMECRGRAIDAVRREASREERHRRQETSSPEADGTADLAVRRDTCEAVREALEQLPSELREPLVLAFYSGLTYRDVAELLDLPEGTVKSRLRRALHRLTREPMLAAGS